MEYKDYYKIMGVGRDASADDIKRAYRRLARKYHPDVSKEKDAEERFKEIGEAYEVLRDPEKRAAYDALGTRKPGEEFRPPPDWQFDYGAETRRRRAQRFLRAAVRRIGARRPRVVSQPRLRHGRASRGHARRGVSRRASGGCRCSALRSTSAAERSRRRSELNVRIPAGVVDGQRIRVASQGQPGVGGGPAGDLFLEVRLLPHRWFRAEGRDIWLDLPVTPWEAALGETVRVPTLGGRVDLKLPKGSQTDRQLRLRGRGLPGNPAGDQLVVLKIMTPPPRDAAGEALYKQMADTLAMNPRQAMEGSP